MVALPPLPPHPTWNQVAMTSSLVKVLGHHYFTKQLLPLMTSTNASPDGKGSNSPVSYSAHAFGSLKFETFKDTAARQKLVR
ncbi:hypothetical protein OG21DRAFT_1504305 [Imleria badia]|nr:hypothetical protein OG21DRAFT_1504305 [Imleria badia]